MSDPGSVERNTQQAAIALQRASQRNGGQNVPSSPPSSVTGADPVPSRAVSTPTPYVGTIDGPGGPPSTEYETSTDGVLSMATKGAELGKAAAHIGESHDSVLSWGRSGQVENTVGRADVPTIPEGAGISATASERLRATPPDTFGVGPQPDTNHNRSWSAADIFNNTRIGG